jgi:hypothetical protein
MRSDGFVEAAPDEYVEAGRGVSGRGFRRIGQVYCALYPISERVCRGDAFRNR